MSTTINDWLTIQEIAQKARVSEKTIRRYAKNNVFAWVQDPQGRIRCEPGVVEKVREHLFAHGGPGGRPIPQ